MVLSRNRALRRFCENSALGARLSARFVAGMEIEDALRVAEALNRQGIAVTLDSLGESVTGEAEALRAAEVYHRLLDEIERRKLNANISVKLTQMGLLIAPELAFNVVESLAEHAAHTHCFVRVDMEDHTLTDATLEIVRRIHARPETANAIGVVIQACLYRSREDVEALIEEGIGMRLCKGAYKEPASVAFPRKADVDAGYIVLSRLLLASEISHGLATHDEKMIDAAVHYARENGIPPERWEIQMLYGVRRELQRQLAADGCRVRVYVPFGREWFPYFMRRLAERPANVLFLARNFFRR
jgi:proline dehydrogenase